MPANEDPTPEEYYGPCTRDYRRVNNEKAWESYFTATEPGEMPRHSTVISTTKAEAIMALFITRLMTDVGKNAVIGWVRGTPLPHPKNPRQPLGDGTQTPETP